MDYQEELRFLEKEQHEKAMQEKETLNERVEHWTETFGKFIDKISGNDA